MKKVIASTHAPAAIGPYSQAVLLGEELFVSGQLPIDMDTGDLVMGDIEQATHACMKNLRNIMEEAGGTMDDILKTTIYLTSMDTLSIVNNIYAQYFQGDYPARSCFTVVALPKGAQVEIEAIASIRT